MLSPTNTSAPATAFVANASDAQEDFVIFRVHDSLSGQYLKGRFLSEGGMDVDMPPTGAILAKKDIVGGRYSVLVDYEGTVVSIPLELDHDRVSQMNTSKQYVMEVDGPELRNRYFMVIDKDETALAGMLSLDNVTVGVTDEEGIIQVGYGTLHPGTMAFTWIKNGRPQGMWELDYTSEDVQYLYFKIPIDTSKFGPGT